MGFKPISGPAFTTVSFRFDPRAGKIFVTQGSDNFKGSLNKPPARNPFMYRALKQMASDEWRDLTCTIGRDTGMAAFDLAGLVFVNEFVSGKPFDKMLAAVASQKAYPKPSKAPLSCPPPAPKQRFAFPDCYDPLHAPAPGPAGFQSVSITPQTLQYDYNSYYCPYLQYTYDSVKPNYFR